MEQSVNLGFIMIRRNSPEKRSLSEALDLCRNAGFMKFDYLSDLNAPDYLDLAKSQREEIESRGMSVFQSHCPFFRYEENGLEKFKAAAPKAVKAAAALGSKFFVIHADEYRMDQAANADEVLLKTREYLAPVIDLCVQNGIRPAIENLFDDGFDYAKKRTRYTSEAEEVLAVIDSFPGSGIGCCWDSGHHNVSFGSEKFMEKLELLALRVICTHMHDNHYGKDLHKPAFFGTIPWEKVMPVLKKAGYTGTFNWEFVYERVPDDFYPEYLEFIKKIGDKVCAF